MFLGRGGVLTGSSLGRVDNNGNLDICGGISYENGAFIALRGKDTDIPNQKRCCYHWR